jgi:nucleoside-diphosphate-sugar epimerase
MGSRVLEEDVQQFVEHFELWNQLKGKTFLITGATGLIGSVMIKCLLELNRQRHLGVKILAAVRSLEKANLLFGQNEEDLQILQIELKDVNAKNIGQKVDYVIHLASPTAGRFMEENPVETFDLAYRSTYALLSFAKQTDVKSVVYVSSLEYYGQVLDDRIITEDAQGYVDPQSSRSSYPMGKRAAEYLCFAFSEEYGTPAKIARLTQTFGAGISENDHRVFAQFARSIIHGEDIVLHTTGESAKPYCYTMDCISAILYILLKGQSGEAYNVANPDTYISIRDLAEFMRQHFNPSIDVRVELNDKMGYAPVTKLNLSAKKLMALGWQPRYGLKEMFEQLINYLKIEL